MSQYSAQDIPVYSAKVLRYIESFSVLRMVLLTFIFMMEIEKLLVQDSSFLIDFEMYSYKREEIT